MKFLKKEVSVKVGNLVLLAILEIVFIMFMLGRLFETSTLAKFITDNKINLWLGIFLFVIFLFIIQVVLIFVSIMPKKKKSV